MQKRKNIRLIISLVVVLIAILGLQLFKPKSGNLNVDKKLFQLDPQQEITDVYLQGEGISNHLQFKNGQWYVNDTLLLDQSMRDVFFSVLTQLEIRRPVAKSSQDTIAGYLLNNGIQTTISYGNKTIKRYYVGGDSNKDISWIMDSEEQIPYEVHIPGYQTYTAGIFKVPANDWRSRFVIDVNFALIKSIKLSYPNKEDNIELVSTKDFFKITNTSADSTKIADFLDNLAYLQADKFLSDDEISGGYDSLIKNNKVFARIEIVMSYGENPRLTFYEPLADNHYILSKISDGSVCVFDFNRVEGVFIRRGEL